MDKISLLKDSGLKVTQNRLQILEVLAKSKNPLSVEEISLKIKESCDLSTIFRTVKSFLEKGIVSESEYGEGFSRYFLTTSHTHFIQCRNCKKLEPLNVCSIHPMVKKAEEMGFANINHKVEIVGICKKCQS